MKCLRRCGAAYHVVMVSATEWELTRHGNASQRHGVSGHQRQRMANQLGATRDWTTKEPSETGHANAKLNQLLHWPHINNRR